MIGAIRQVISAGDAAKVQRLLREYEKHSKATISYAGAGDAIAARSRAKKADKAIKDLIKILQVPG